MTETHLTQLQIKVKKKNNYKFEEKKQKTVPITGFRWAEGKCKEL